MRSKFRWFNLCWNGLGTDLSLRWLKPSISGKWFQSPKTWFSCRLHIIGSCFNIFISKKCWKTNICNIKASNILNNRWNRVKVLSVPFCQHMTSHNFVLHVQRKLTSLLDSVNIFKITWKVKLGRVSHQSDQLTWKIHISLFKWKGITISKTANYWSLYFLIIVTISGLLLSLYF